ncbi:MAG TPA: Gfo/Idh/MocA family oxidoreductase, partial [Kofleriaceae bacterium]
ELGAIHHVQIACQSYLPEWRPGTNYRESYSARADEGGVLRDLIHEIDYAAWLFGWPTAVRAQLGNTGRLGIAAEEWADVSWQAPNAASVSIHLDYLTRPARRVMRAYGEHGTLELDLIKQNVTHLRVGQPSTTAQLTQDRDDMMADQARAFLAAIDGGNPGVLATLDDGARALAICDAARESAQTHAVTAVRDWRSA